MIIATATKEGDWFIIGFSPRKANIALYNLRAGVKQHQYDFGKYKSGKSCIYINKLKDVDEDVFKDVIRLSIKKHEETGSNMYG